MVVITPMCIGNTLYPLPSSTFLTFVDILFPIVVILIPIVVILIPTVGIIFLVAFSAAFPPAFIPALTWVAMRGGM